MLKKGLLEEVKRDIEKNRINRREIEKYGVLQDFLDNIPSQYLDLVALKFDERCDSYALFLNNVKLTYLDLIEYVSYEVNDKFNKKIEFEDSECEVITTIEFIRNTNKFRVCDHNVLGWKEYELEN
ncbi:hypothetical protein JW813_07555 [Clostridium botulinum]|uniref:hypothetical protein n=1 Tax=Clostridium botulinum TaxID=1491 RepID=UPI002247025F|nr:hypothetical protein [Clostridium botulinum]UZP04855.1 hypothetical protein JW813_07555 [Clostridium botulinum]UZP08266.1 hypothetical protein JYA71_07825 [Clostridium botulinum]UZP11594.1 hypothetical protein JYA74_07550 [Clostridium botulinum]